MFGKANGWILSGVVIALCGCEKPPTKVADAPPAGSTTQMAEEFSATMPDKPIEWLDVSTDEPKPFETKVGKDFVVKKSGLAWKVLDEGFQRMGGGVELGQKVDVRYTIYTMDMKSIDSNEDAKMGTYSFVLGAKNDDVRLFWHEAVVGMKLKAKKRLIVPPNLAWGAEGRFHAVKKGEYMIKPNETLIIDVKVENFAGKSNAQRAKDAAAATQPDVPTTLPADLIVEETKEGTGEYLKKGQRGTFKYVGKLADGSVFDKGDSFACRLGANEVIVGWELGVHNMRVGSVRKLTIPAKYAYGEGGKGPVPPNATLYFELELVKIDP